MSALRTASAIVGGVGVILLFIGVYLLQNRLAIIHTWRPVNARVTGGSVETQESVESTSYRARWELAYVLDGNPIRTIVPAPGSELELETAQHRLARHPPGSQALIHVNPNDPAQVRLNVGVNVVTLAAPLWFLLGSMSLLMFALSLWLMGTPGVTW
jgi:hypothetical protein